MLTVFLRAVILLAAAISIACAAPAKAKVHAVSTDGEATVYVVNDFNRNFDLLYRVDFPQSRGNRGWTAVSVLLLGRTAASASIGAGFSRTPVKNGSRLEAFTDADAAGQAAVYRSVPVACAPTCTLELRGDARTVSAFVNHREIGSWLRSRMGMSKPYVQINAEVSEIGDRIVAGFTPMRTEVRGRRIPPPTCAFTTQGVRAWRTAGAALKFFGRRDPSADAAYISLIDGSSGDRCPRARR
jgi:hypothetical protein